MAVVRKAENLFIHMPGNESDTKNVMLRHMYKNNDITFAIGTKFIFCRNYCEKVLIDLSER